MNDARCMLEDKINAELGGIDFGAERTNLLIVMFCTSSISTSVAPTRLSSDGQGNQVLALHVVVEADLVNRTAPGKQLGLLCSHIVHQLPERPLRKPKGLNYEKLREALVACIRPLAESAA
jgi:hypothetical protein